jgi:hypothetical protein
MNFGKANAQTYLSTPLTTVDPFASMSMPDYQEYQENRQFSQKWFVTHYASVSAGTVFYPGANAFYVSAPIGWQLNRQLNRNLYAFGGVYAAPTVTSFNTGFMNSPYNKSYPGAYPGNYFGINPGVYMGLMYVNESGTFSISGSIRAQSGSYPAYPVAPASRARK